MSKKILITGATGFIGSFLVEKALEKNFEVHVAIRKSSSKQYLQDKKIIFHYLDFSSKENLKKELQEIKSQVEKFDVIIHNAGVTKAKNVKEYDTVNNIYTRNFLDTLLELDFKANLFIFTSSLAAFGCGKPGTTEPVMLHHDPKPVNLYGKSKLDAEKYLQSLKDFPYLIFRPTGVYGPREKDYYVFFKTINNHIEAYIGFQKQYLTFIYVKDYVNLVFKAIESNIRNKAYFVADGQYYDSETFSKITKKVLNKKTIKIKVPISVVKGIAFLLENISKPFGKYPTLNKEKVYILEANNWICETEQLKTDFDFDAEYDLEKGVIETIEWYKKEKWL